MGIQINGQDVSTRPISVKCIPDTTALSTGDGKIRWTVPEELDGMRMATTGGHVYAASSSGAVTFQIHNETQGSDMLSTAITIDASEYDSEDAATPPVIDSAHAHISAGDVLRFDCDSAGTGVEGMEIRMGFR